MEKIGLILVGVLTILALFSGVALAGCDDDCLLTFETCLKLCRQTTKPDSEEGGKCAFHCMKGRDGCLRRCKTKDKQSENIVNKEILMASENCVCVECNRKCGTGHETWCSSYQKPKAKPDIETQKAVILSSSEENITETFLLALGGKLCCVEGEKVIGRCHELTPYYNPFNGECYASRDDCKKSHGGYDVCLKCTTPCK